MTHIRQPEIPLHALRGRELKQEHRRPRRPDQERTTMPDDRSERLAPVRHFQAALAALVPRCSGPGPLADTRARTDPPSATHEACRAAKARARALLPAHYR